MSHLPFRFRALDQRHDQRGIQIVSCHAALSGERGQAPGAILRRAGQRPRTCPAAIRPNSNAAVPVVTTGSCAAKSRRT
jgi:hypothetical protein